MNLVFRYTLLLVLLLTLGCYIEEDYNKPLDPKSFTLLPATNTILADGSSTATIVLQIPGESADTLSGVTFRTTAGIFVESGSKTYSTKAKKGDDQTLRIASVTLQSSTKVEDAVVSVELFDNLRSETIQFTNATPENLIITPSTFSIKPSNTSSGEVSIEVLTTRSSGKPSIGNEVELKAYNNDFSKEIGSFRVYNNRTDTNGKANFIYVLGDSIANRSAESYIGIVNIVGSILNPNGGKKEKTVQLISSR